MIERARSWATADLRGWCDHCRGARPLNYVATLRFDAPPLGLSHDLSQTGAMAQLLLAAGAPVNGNPGDHETPLMTAASHDDADVARVPIAAHAQLDALASAALLERRRRAGVDRLDEVWQMTRAGKNCRSTPSITSTRCCSSTRRSEPSRGSHCAPANTSLSSEVG